MQGLAPGRSQQQTAFARQACAKPSARRQPTRAVMAAEDQRFFEHAGFDLAELTASFQRNQHEGRIERGASVVPALARLLAPVPSARPPASCANCCTQWKWSKRLARRASCVFTWTAPWAVASAAEAAARQYFGIRARELMLARPSGWLPCCTTPSWKPNTGPPLPHQRGACPLGSQRHAAHATQRRDELVNSLAEVDWPAPAARLPLPDGKPAVAVPPA